jgi:hypothetical protein
MLRAIAVNSRDVRELVWQERQEGKNLLFVNKKKQKNFIRLALAIGPRASPAPNG